MVGMAVLEGDFEKAVDLYVGMEGSKEGAEAENFRSSWREKSDPNQSLEIAPDRLGYERAILEHLVKKARRLQGCIRDSPKITTIANDTLRTISCV